jgi:hypothetical protein
MTYKSYVAILQRLKRDARGQFPALQNYHVWRVSFREERCITLILADEDAVI